MEPDSHLELTSEAMSSLIFISLLKKHEIATFNIIQHSLLTCFLQAALGVRLKLNAIYFGAGISPGEQRHIPIKQDQGLELSGKAQVDSVCQPTIGKMKRPVGM